MTPLITVNQLSKRFPGVRALHEVRIDVMPGEVHALMGEHGVTIFSRQRRMDPAWKRNRRFLSPGFGAIPGKACREGDRSGRLIENEFDRLRRGRVHRSRHECQQIKDPCAATVSHRSVG